MIKYTVNKINYTAKIIGCSPSLQSHRLAQIAPSYLPSLSQLLRAKASVHEVERGWEMDHSMKRNAKLRLPSPTSSAFGTFS